MTITTNDATPAPVPAPAPAPTSGLRAARRWWTRRRRAPLPLVLVGAAVALFALIPLGFVIYNAVAVDPHEASRLLLRARTGELLGNTLRLVVASTALCAVLGVGAAWLVERTDLPGRRLFTGLLAAPLVVPAFVSGYGWVSITPSVQGLGGAVLVVSLAYYPLIYLPVAATLRGLDPALEESARSLGLGSARVFLRVVLPQLKPALFGGALLVALHMLSEFGAFALLRFSTFTTAIYEQYQVSFNGPAANLLASVLVLLCVLLLVAELGVRGHGRYARLGGGVARSIPRVRLGRGKPLALLAVLVVLGAALGVPLGSLAYWLAVGSSASWPGTALLHATVASVGYGLVAAVVTTLLALPVALLVVRHRSVASVVIERSTYIARALPGIVVALALVFVSIRVARPLYQTALLLVAAYAILFLPMALIAVRAALVQAPPRLTEVARALGVRPLSVLRRVTLPLIAPGLGAGAALVFLSVVTELTATLLLAPIGTNTLATQVWSNSAELAYGAAAPYAAVMILIAAPATYLLTRPRAGVEVV